MFARTHPAAEEERRSGRLMRSRILAMPLLGAAVCSAAAARHSREVVRVELPFETVKTAKLMIVRVTIARKTGDFLFDTGDELTLLDREFAGLPKPKCDKDTAHPDGQSGITTVKWVDVGPMCLEGFCLDKRKVGIAELGFFPRLGRRIDGIIGQDVLREFDEVLINYRTEIVTLRFGGGGERNAKP